MTLKSYFWPGLGLPSPKAKIIIPKLKLLPNHFTKKKKKKKKIRVKVRSTACHDATKKRPVKITMYLGLDITIKLKF